MRYLEAKALRPDVRNKALQPVEADKASAFDAAKATKAELKAEAERRGLTVTRADGGEGEPLAEDYRAALQG